MKMPTLSYELRILTKDQPRYHHLMLRKPVPIQQAIVTSGKVDVENDSEKSDIDLLASLQDWPRKSADSKPPHDDKTSQLRQRFRVILLE